jgi:hypothetical protein
MIRTHSDDPDVAQAAQTAAGIVDEILTGLAPSTEFDYGGHILKLDEYDMCTQCTRSIAEAQSAHKALVTRAEHIADEEVRAHVELAAEVFELEGRIAVVRAELHNGQASEPIINRVLGHVHDRAIHDSYQHSHHTGDTR